MSATTAGPKKGMIVTVRGKPVDVGAILLEGRAFIALIVLIVVFSSMSDTFLAYSNLLTMTKHVAINAVLAIGMLFVILKGGIDLSIGSTLGLAGIVAGIFLQGVKVESLGVIIYPPVWVVIMISLAVGTFVGYINGLLITRFQVAPFIATLGMLYVARGTALLISNGKTLPRLQGNAELGNTGFNILGVSRPFGVPMQIWIMIVVAAIGIVVLAKTPFGRAIYAVGGNERAAELAGVPVNKVKVRAYMISGFCAGIAGLVTASQLTSSIPNSGESFELNAIAACVIGGASLMGGRGTIRGVLLGAFVIGFLNDGLVNIQVSTFWQTTIKGAVIIVAVIIDQTQQRIKTSKNAAIAAASTTESRDASQVSGQGAKKSN
jgi:erythritol transport system permease protein